MRTVKDPSTRNQEILTGALKVFARKGYDKTTIADIARELGISQGLCYRYYESKEAIYNEELEEYANYIVKANQARFKKSDTTLKEKILAYSGRMNEYRKPESDNDLLYSLFHGENSRQMHDQLMLKISAKLVPFIKTELDEAVKKGEIQCEDTESLAHFFVYGQMGLLMNQGDTEEVGQRIQKFLIQLLGL